ncbi:LysR family transcriptional regulator [Noviherbaspirillum sp.]|uniref:LysR family transcriptional regulator n=1 Tax=Noviherbaspirillum sp. TaxID=1926288 RepID=UPI002D73FEA3|nr:LysR family transcriptional regulator [Noviherbaspirillum sp.]HZW23041.1 LysR family transcriptional regulator [Noviherbaspirillum sp.]
MDNLQNLRAFRRVVESTSFTRAAETLDISPGSVSKLIAALEQHLGTRLLARSTRRMSLTEAGRIYYAHCVRILDELDHAERAVQQLVDVPRGTLRVSVPTSFGILWLSGRLPAFLRQFPEIRLDVVASDQYVDLVEGGFDLALRISRKLQDSSMVAKPLGEIPHVVVASPAYFKSAGKPRAPDELVRHNCLVYSQSQMPGEWAFGEGKSAVVVPVQGNYQCNNSVMLRAALLDGIGMTQTPLPVVEDLLKSRQLVTCLDDYRPPPHRIFAMLPQQRAVSPKVRAFIDFMAEQLGARIKK